MAFKLFALSGKISDRIRGNYTPEVAKSVMSNRAPVDDRPSASAVRHGKGKALGKPSRSDRSAKTHDE